MTFLASLLTDVNQNIVCVVKLLAFAAVSSSLFNFLNLVSIENEVTTLFHPKRPLKMKLPSNFQIRSQDGEVHNLKEGQVKKKGSKNMFFLSFKSYLIFLNVVLVTFDSL